MKILLPLGALATLSSLFMISDRFDPATTLPIAEIDLRQRAQEQGASNATFSGMTTSGDEVVLRTDLARPKPGNQRIIEANSVSGRMLLEGGAEILMRSDSGELNQSRNLATLSGNVAFDTSTGYHMRSKLLRATFDTLYAESPGSVSGKAPGGDLTAGRMVLEMRGDDPEPYLLFTNGVKLIYQPQSSGD